MTRGPAITAGSGVFKKRAKRGARAPVPVFRAEEGGVGGGEGKEGGEGSGANRADPGKIRGRKGSAKVALSHLDGDDAMDE